MRVVFASAEVSPFAKTGGLGDVCGALPIALRKLGHEVTVFTPYYRQTHSWLQSNNIQAVPVIPTLPIEWSHWSAGAAVLRAELPGSDVPVYFVASEHFFNREGIYSPQFDGRDDSVERYTFFCRAVIRACEVLGIEPDIVHAHDWHTALLPVYLHSGLRGSHVFRNARAVFTIHNLNYQGATGPDRFGFLGLHSRYWAPDGVEHFGTLNLMKGGILFADQVTTVSPNYSREIRTPQFGAGLDGVLRSLDYKLHGILNGIDTEEWDPGLDEFIPSNFEAGKLAGKAICKRALLREAGLRHRARTPLLGVVSRLVDQKGFQLLIPVLRRILQAGAQVVILGSGEARYESAFDQIARERPESCKTWIGFDNALAHRIYAGADMLLMPSLYEPCGLNQMYALRYGTIPVVRMTGGLADSVIPFDGTNASQADGFGFSSTQPVDLYATTWISMLNFRDAGTWKQLQRNGMEADFSWHQSAREYEVTYERARSSW